MPPKTAKQRLIPESMIMAGLGLALIYWVLDALIYGLSAPGNGFYTRLVGADSESIWPRILVLSLFAVFGAIGRFMLQRQQEQDARLRESEEKYRSIIETMEEGYFEVDLSGRLTFANEALCRMAGLSGDKLLGMNNRDFTSDATAGDMYRTFNRILTTGAPGPVTSYEILRPDGSQLVLELSASLIRSATGKAVGFRGIARDVSERIRSETEKRQLESQLQQAQKMEAIGTLASGIAHDFNNIMMGILGNTSLMLAKIDDAHPHHQKLKNIEKYIHSGSDLTKQLLGFARGGKYMVQPTRVRDMALSSAQMFSRTRKEIRIHTDRLGDTWAVDVDRGQIDQVLLNLFVNAWQAMPDGGDIHLDCANVELADDGTLPFRVMPGRYVRLSVRDTGTGMEPDVQRRIFEPFFTTKEMGRGTGLGLASVYGIVKNHGGYINVTSAPGAGATFDLFLPASVKAPAEPAKPAALEKGSETVLLVDDEKITLDVGGEILQELGYSVLTARGGGEALAIYRKHGGRIDLVILDMIMPDMSGIRTFEALKTLDADVKVLMVSGDNLTGEAARILNQSGNDFIQKPFSMRQLSDKIRHMLAPPGGSSAAAAP